MSPILGLLKDRPYLRGMAAIHERGRCRRREEARGIQRFNGVLIIAVAVPNKVWDACRARDEPGAVALAGLVSS
jgi:hypothetical protein